MSDEEELSRVDTKGKSEDSVRGRLLLSIDKRIPGIILAVVAVAFFGGGITAAIAGQLWAIFLVVLSPVLFWMGLSLAAERLTVTTEGVYHLQGVGVAQRSEVRDAVTWSAIEQVKLEVKRTRGANNQSSTEYTLIFARGEEKPLKYLAGLPTKAQLDALRALCEERGIDASL